MRAVRAMLAMGAAAILWSGTLTGVAQAEEIVPQVPGEVAPTLAGSTITNLSDRSLRIGRNWCGDSNAPHVGGPSCGGTGTGSDYAWLSSGSVSWSKWWVDTDTFGIIGGCTASAAYYTHTGRLLFVNVYTPSTTTWYKVSDVQHAIISTYNC